MKRKSLMGIVLTILALCYTEVSAQIVADHTVVSYYDDIPQQYIDSVKTMLVSIAGESHSGAYRHGQVLLELLDTTFHVETYDESAPLAYSDQYLRIGRHEEIGESIFFSRDNVESMKAYISSQNSTGNAYDVMGFGWCWDMSWQNPPGGIEDTVYRVHWAGASQGGPDGNQRWGLDSGDSALTGNRVNMDTYLAAVEEFNQHCRDSVYPTQWIFTTGPVDGNAGTENGVQREIKQDYIREYVWMDTTHILFDYADILCWSDSGDQHIAEWDDDGEIRPHAQIHPDNHLDYDNSFNMIPGQDADLDHIGEVGALRIAKAMWWMLARISGWDGDIMVTEIQLSSEGDTTKVMTGGELQFSVTVLSEDAFNRAFSLRVIEGSGTATISTEGLLSAGLPGEVEVLATALDGSGVADTFALTVTEPLAPVTGITVFTEGGISAVDMGSSLQCLATVEPDTASNPGLVWSLFKQSGTASVDQEGLLLGLTPGIVEVIATAVDGTWMADTLELTIADTTTYVTDIEIISSGNVNEVNTGEELQFSATVLPQDAHNPMVAWSVVNRSGSATISAEGLLKASLPGEVDVVASAVDGSGVGDTIGLTITSPMVPVTQITVSAAGGTHEMDVGTSLQFSATVLPADASNPWIAWSVHELTGTAVITQSGLLTATKEGTVNVMASAIDGSDISSSYSLNITQPVSVLEEGVGPMVRLYPNPGPGKFYLEPGDLVIERIDVISATGSMVLVLHPDPGSREIGIDLSNQSPGAFFVHLVSEEYSIVKRLLIVR